MKVIFRYFEVLGYYYCEVLGSQFCEVFVNHSRSLVVRYWRRRPQDQVKAQLVRLHTPHPSDKEKSAERGHYQARHVQCRLEQRASSQNIR